MNFIVDETETKIVHTLPYNPLKDPALYQEAMARNEGVQFSHTMEEQIGCQLQAGFRLTHLYEDTNGVGNLHEHHIPSLLRHGQLNNPIKNTGLRREGLPKVLFQAEAFFVDFCGS